MLPSSTMPGAVPMAAQVDSPSVRFGHVIRLAVDFVVAASPRAGRKAGRQ